jgi:hypothetical protein
VKSKKEYQVVVLYWHKSIRLGVRKEHKQEEQIGTRRNERERGEKEEKRWLVACSSDGGLQLKMSLLGDNADLKDGRCYALLIEPEGWRSANRINYRSPTSRRSEGLLAWLS